MSFQKSDKETDMAISKKGLRTIIVEDEKYYWKFVNKVMVFNHEYTNGVLSIDFGYFDIWDYVNDQENKPPDFTPKVVTPKFVSESIKFALKNGWSKNKMSIKFKNGIYKVI